MNWPVLGVASGIFIVLLIAISASFFKQYTDILMPYPKLFKHQKWLFLIPLLLGAIVFGLTMYKANALLHVYGIGIYQKDQIKTSTEMTIIVEDFLLVLMWSLSTILIAINHKKRLKLALLISLGLITLTGIFGLYMALNLDYSLFNGLTA